MKDEEKQTEEDNKQAQGSNDEEGLELDKLHTSPQLPAKASAALTPANDETEADEVKPSPKKAGNFWKGFADIAKDKAFIISILAGIVISAIVLLVPFKKLFLGAGSPNDEPVGKIVYTVSSYLGFRHNIKFRLSIDYVNMEERRTFMRKLPKLKEALASTGNLLEVKKAVAEKNLNFLERHVLTLIRDTIGAPPERLHVEQLRLD
ncbi:MAG: hypothetical protein JRF24_03595 [Deltaproteobacteria bacterium]|nr:hypothetical protein [Deltaproteobacteria bacterium]